MLAYIVRRTVYGLVVVFGVLLLLFALFFLYAKPIEMARRAVGEKAPPEVLERWVVNHGYDKPAFWNPEDPADTLIVDHFRRMLTFDFGKSDADGSLIGPQIRRRMVPSMVLTVPLFLTGVVVSSGDIPQQQTGSEQPVEVDEEEQKGDQAESDQHTDKEFTPE